jgi:hypothetical protein
MESLLEGRRKPVHASNRLQHGRLHHEDVLKENAGPQIFVQQQPQVDGIAWHPFIGAGAGQSTITRTG